MTNIDYRRAFKIACELLNGDVLYGVDTDKIFELMMQKDGVVSSSSYEEYILNHLQDLDQGQYVSSSEKPNKSENPTSSDLSSGTRKNSEKLENVSHIIDWNNCHTSEQLDSISTTKNDLGVDNQNIRLIDANALIKRLRPKHFDWWGEGEQDDFSKGNNSMLEEVIEAIEEFPSVTPQEPKIGHWIMSDDGLYRPICDKCGAHPWKGYIPTVEEATEVFKYCPNCGAKMVEPQKSEDKE